MPWGAARVAYTFTRFSIIPPVTAPAAWGRRAVTSPGSTRPLTGYRWMRIAICSSVRRRTGVPAWWFMRRNSASCPRALTKIRWNTSIVTPACNTGPRPTVGRAPRTTLASGSSIPPSNISAAVRPNRNWTATWATMMIRIRSSSITGKAAITTAVPPAALPPVRPGAGLSARFLFTSTRCLIPGRLRRRICKRWPPPPATRPSHAPGRIMRTRCLRTPSPRPKSKPRNGLTTGSTAWITPTKRNAGR